MKYDAQPRKVYLTYLDEHLVHLALHHLDGGRHPRAARALHSGPGVAAQAHGTLGAD